MNMSTADLMKAMEGGKLSTKEFMGPFLQAMEDLGAPGLSAGLNTTGRAYQRLKNATEDTQDVFMEAGFGNALKALMDGFTNIMAAAKPFVAFLGGVLGAVIEDVTFPFRLLFAIILDIADFIGNKFGMEVDAGTNSMAKFGRIVGHVISFFLGGGLIKLIAKGFKFLGPIGDWLISKFQFLAGILEKVKALAVKLRLIKGDKVVDFAAGAQALKRGGSKAIEMSQKASALTGGVGTEVRNYVEVNVKSDDSHIKTKVSKHTSTRRDRRR